MKSILAAALFSVMTLTGCVSVGRSFDSQKVAALKPGISTRADAIKDLGTPVSIHAMGAGKQLLQWMYTYGTIIGSGSKSVAIMFDADDKMIEVSSTTNL